jgi:pimeloyl-ACP methyl ester carboxylesterase
MTTSAAPRESVVRARGVEVFVREQGDGHPLLMINGLGGSVDMWGGTEDGLARVARTIAFDAPGTGRTTTQLWPLTISSLAKLATGLLDELGHERVDVLGFSLGGLIAQQLAYRSPERVRRMALVSTACGWGSMPGTLEALAVIAMPFRYYSRLLYQQTSWLLSPADAALLRRDPTLVAARLDHPPAVGPYLGYLWAGALWSSLPWLPSVRVPTLVVQGEGDELVPPANALQLARLLPESRVHILADEGHLFVYDAQSAALPLLADFFSAPALEESAAWTSGGIVDEDAVVDASFEASVGATPHRELSAIYRRFVKHAYHQNGHHNGHNGNGHAA